MKVLEEALPSIVLQSKAPATIRDIVGLWAMETMDSIQSRSKGFSSQSHAETLYLSYLIRKSKTCKWKKLLMLFLGFTKWQW